MVRRIRRITSFRRDMWRWMNGPGLNFRDPNPDGPNYMGAYDLRTGKRLMPNETTSGTDQPTRRRRDGLDGGTFRRSSNEALNQAAEGQGHIEDGSRDTVDDFEIKNPLSANPGGGDSVEDRANLIHSTTGSASAVMRFPFGYDTSMYPFPLNAYFRSQPVLSEEFRQEIYSRVVDRGWSVREVSAAMGVSMERVGAVVRLGEIERRWQEERKPLATFYARAVLSMLPTTPYKPLRTSAFSPPQQQQQQQQQQQSHKSNSSASVSASASSSSSGPSSMTVGSNASHEPINDLPIHASTRQQLFHPVAESAHFTRADAAHVFNRHLLPADARIPHAELIALERDRLSGVDRKVRDANLKERSDALDEVSRRRLGRSIASINNNNINKPTSPSTIPGTTTNTTTTLISPSLNPPNLHARTHSTSSLKVVSARRWTFMFQDVTVDADAGERHGRLIQSRKLPAGKGGRVGGKNRYIVGERGLGAAVGTPGMNAGIDFDIARGIANPVTGAGAGAVTGPENGEGGGQGQVGRVGWRYGVPHNDRKKGLSKIATFVD